MTAGDRPARERIQRTLILALGIGAIVFGTLLAAGPSGFLAQIDQLRQPFGIVAVAVGIGVPATYIVLSRALPLRPLLAIVGATSLLFLLLELAWPLLMTERLLADDATPWIQGINAIHATAAAIVWPRVIGWVYPLMQGPIVAFTQIQVRDDATLEAMLDGLGAIVFSLILCGVSIAVIRAGDRQDAAAAHARAQAALEASRRTQEAEQSRINAIVHDDVMSVLLAASREAPPTELPGQARRALSSVEALVSGGAETHDYDPDEFVAVIRSTAAGIDPGVPVRFSVEGRASLPARIVAAFAEATAEALRNVERHAGDAARARVDVDVDDDAAQVVVADQGLGFAPDRVSERRLGIRVSIVERLAAAGGEASLASAPGEGTTVALHWSHA